jgi:WD40 repeat protein
MMRRAGMREEIMEEPFVKSALRVCASLLLMVPYALSASPAEESVSPERVPRLTLIRRVAISAEPHQSSWNSSGTKLAVSTILGVPVNPFAGPMVMVMDAETFDIEHGFTVHKGAGEVSVAFGGNGKWIAAGAGDVEVLDIRSGTEVASLSPPYGPVTHPNDIGVRSIVASPAEDVFAVAYSGGYMYGDRQGYGNVVALFRARPATMIWSSRIPGVIGGRPIVTSPLAFTRDGKELVFGAEEGGNGKLDVRICVIAAKDGSTKRAWEHVHTMGPKALALSAGDRYLATSSLTGTKESGPWGVIDNRDPIRIWDYSSQALLKELPVEHAAWSLAFAEHAHWLFATYPFASGSDRLLAWDWQRTTTPIRLGSDQCPGASIAVDDKHHRISLVGAGVICLYQFDFVLAPGPTDLARNEVH